MAWNPAPEVAVARDAAQRLGALANATVDQIVVLYITADGRLGLSTYGKDKMQCARAKRLGEQIYTDTRNLWIDDE